MEPPAFVFQTKVQREQVGFPALEANLTRDQRFHQARLCCGLLDPRAVDSKICRRGSAGRAARRLALKVMNPDFDRPVRQNNHKGITRDEGRIWKQEVLSDTQDIIGHTAC